jgi:hypothetical protein
MTTAFAWFTRGFPIKAWRASPAGCLLVPLAPLVATWLALCSWFKRPVGFRSIGRPLIVLLVAIVLSSLVFWFLRILGVSAYLGFAGLPPAGMAG